MNTWQCESLPDCRIDGFGAGGSAVAVVNAAELKAAVASTREQTLAVDVLANGSVELVTARRRLAIPAIATVDELPADPHFEPRREGATRTIAAEYFGCAATFAALIRCTLYATDPDSCRYALSGVMVQFAADGCGLTMVGTDGRRLAAASTNSAIDWRAADPEHAFIWPAAHAEAAHRALTAKPAAFARLAILVDSWQEPAAKPEAEPVKHSQPWLQLTVMDANGFALTVQTGMEVEGRFPKWQDVVPTFPVAGTVDAAELYELARNMAGSEDCRGADFTFSHSGNQGTLNAELARADGSAVTGWAPASFEFANAPITLDGRYVADVAGAAAAIDALPIDVCLSDPNKPAVFRFTAFPKQPRAVKTSEIAHDFALSVTCWNVVMPLSRDRRAEVAKAEAEAAAKLAAEIAAETPEPATDPTAEAAAEPATA